MEVYKLKIALRGISPMVLRRMKIAGNTDLGDLHTIIQLAMGFTHLGRFSVEFREYFGESPRETLAMRLRRKS